MKKALIGFGGHAREVMSQMGLKLPCYVDDKYVGENSLPLSKLNFDEYEIMVAVGDSKSRMEIVNKLPKNVKFFSFIHPTSLIMSDNIEIGVGSFVGAYTILTNNIKIGNHSILNRGNQIGHDCIVGDFFSAMPNSVVSGNVTIGNNVYLGTNSTIIEKLSVCSDVTIGANGVVVKNINDSGTYVGVPVKKI